MNYYNEHEPYAVGWLCNLIEAGLIPKGYVDSRDIRDVRPRDLDGFTSCHFFAGLGVWPLALRLSGWADDRPVWTGSCPCQPFSAAGKGAGFDDERHLWPDWHWIIQHGRPRGVPVFGEQVASRDGLAWLDLVQADMENEGATFRAVDLCAAGVGAPHIRQRLFFRADWPVAEPALWRLEAGRGDAGGALGARSGRADAIGCGGADALAHPCAPRLGIVRRWPADQRGHAGRDAHQRDEGNAGRVGDTDSGRAGQQNRELHGDESQHEVGRTRGVHESVASGPARHGRLDNADGTRLALGECGAHAARYQGAGTVQAGPVNGFWSGAAWVRCRDGKARPIEPGTTALAYGVAARVGKLRAYGNAIVVQAAQAFIEASMKP